MTYSISDMMDHVAKGMRSVGFDPEANGLTITRVGRKAGCDIEVVMPYPDGRRPLTMKTKLSETYAPDVLRYVRVWESDGRDAMNRATAGAFFSGRDGAPYMGDVVVGRLLAHHGSSWNDLVERIRRSTGCLNGRDRNEALTTYSGERPPAVFERRYYKRSYGIDGSGLPPMQMLLSTRTRHLALDIEIGPKCMWNGYGKSQIWLEGKYPASLYSAMKGRPVSEMIAHPALEIPELIIKTARYDGARTVIEIPQLQEEIAGRYDRVLAKAA